MLRAEVQQLKSFILAHKDCPLLNQNKGLLDRLKDGWMDGWVGGQMYEFTISFFVYIQKIVLLTSVTTLQWE